MTRWRLANFFILVHLCLFNLLYIMYILQPLMKDGAMLVVKYKRDIDAAGQVLKKWYPID